MLLPAVLATTLLELRTVDLGAVLGWYPPAWGSSVALVRTEYPELAPHTPHFCPSEVPTQSTLHVREPVVWVAGSRPRYLDFGFAPWGLEGVTIEYTRPNWPSPSLLALGPPTCVGSTGMLWKRRNAVIGVIGPGIFVSEPGSASAALAERFICWQG